MTDKDILFMCKAVVVASFAFLIGYAAINLLFMR